MVRKKNVSGESTYRDVFGWENLELGIYRKPEILRAYFELKDTTVVSWWEHPEIVEMYTIGMSPIREGSLDWPDLGLVCFFAMERAESVPVAWGLDKTTKQPMRPQTWTPAAQF